MMISLSASPNLKVKAPPNVAIGRVTASARNSQHDAALWREIEAVCGHVPLALVHVDAAVVLIHSPRRLPSRAC